MNVICLVVLNGLQEGSLTEIARIVPKDEYSWTSVLFGKSKAQK